MKIQRRQLIKSGLATMAAAMFSRQLMAFPHLEKTSDRQNQSYDEADDVQVINAGIGGNNTIDLLKRIDKDCLAFHPKLTVLMIGTNDMNSVKYVPIKDYEKNLNDLVKKIMDSGSKLLMMTILPAYEPYLLTRHPAAFYQPEGVEGRRKQVNEVIKKVASKHKADLLDLEHRFLAIGHIGTSKDSLIQNEANTNKTDGIHPTPTGYKVIGLTVYDYIVDHNLPKTGIVCFGDSITHGDGSIDRNSYPAYLKKLLTV